MIHFLFLLQCPDLSTAAFQLSLSQLLHIHDTLIFILCPIFPSCCSSCFPDQAQNNHIYVMSLVESEFQSS